jgi:hypothetical protein
MRCNEQGLRLSLSFESLVTLRNHEDIASTDA